MNKGIFQVFFSKKLVKNISILTIAAAVLILALPKYTAFAESTSDTGNATILEKKVGDTFKLDFKGMLDNIFNTNLEWTTDNDKVATVSNEGIVEIISEGEVTISLYRVYPLLNTKTLLGSQKIQAKSFKNEKLDAVLPENQPGIRVDGNNVYYDPKVADDLVFKIEKDTNLDHVKITVKGEELRRDVDYTVAKGSVIVTLKKNYIQSLLPNTTHAIRTQTDEGCSEINLIVQREGGTIIYPSHNALSGEIPYLNSLEKRVNGVFVSPRTGDSNNVILYAGLGGAAVLLLGAVILFRKKK